MAESSDGVTAETSVWELGPELVSLEIATWEHAVLSPRSCGRADRVADLQRLLPHELTDLIYERMARAEALFLRRTEPLPPFRERLARDLDTRSMGISSEETVSGGGYGITLEKELQGILQKNNHELIKDIVPNWDAEVARALGVNAAEIKRNFNFVNVGFPKGEFSIACGYRICIRRIKGALLGAPMATHGALLMGCVGPSLQPGPLRDVIGAIFQ
jgi:hypothetical protein